jgi:hypothetical protein
MAWPFPALRAPPGIHPGDQHSCRKGAYRRPQNWNAETPVDPKVQARWFTAACRAVAYYNMRSIWFFQVNLTVNPSSPPSFPAFFEGWHTSEAAIRSCGH